MTQSNYSIYAIPLYFILALLPHSYAIALIKGASNGRWDNANPRAPGTHARIRQRVPVAVLARFERAEAAHQNGMENLAVFAVAVVLGNMAGLGTEMLNGVAAAVVLLRAGYNVVYVCVAGNRWSYARTGLWALMTGLCLWEMMAAGNALRERGKGVGGL
ncbi:hypothetical protein MMC06_001952 [Schaereria dolodes]|nr:hypothetical protein [Schaereria dolodes]